MGLAVKIPSWPFSFWITKTHVEVNTSFSIFLSGILVKIAIIALYKFFFVFDYNSLNYIYIICLIGIIDSSFKMINQTDFKKTIAYLTIQEMNILLFFCMSNNYNNFDII